MPRDLADVLHYFLPELDDDSSKDSPSCASAERSAASDFEAAGQSSPASKPNTSAASIIGVPVGDRDVVRAALVWNLAIESARLGARAIVLAPTPTTTTPLWPEDGIGPMGTEIVFSEARNLNDLAADAAALPRPIAGPGSSDDEIVYVRVPPEWLASADDSAGAANASINWWLLLCSTNHRDLSRAQELATVIHRHVPSASLGVTIHGVSSIDEAHRAYQYLSRQCAHELAFELLSYGLLVDDLHVYRAIVAQKSIGLEHPQAPATRSLMDVAKLILDDAKWFAHA